MARVGEISRNANDWEIKKLETETVGHCHPIANDKKSLRTEDK